MNGCEVYTNTQKVIHNVVQPTSEHITQQQVFILRNLVNDLVDIYEKSGKLHTREDKQEEYRKWNGKLKRKFKVTSYHLISRGKFEEAKAWLHQQVAKERPKLRRTNKPEWRKKYYGAIYARTQQHGIGKAQLFELAQKRLKLKESVDSLKGLNDIQLTKLYKIIFSM